VVRNRPSKSAFIRFLSVFAIPFASLLIHVRIISFAFLLEGSISKAAHRGTQNFDCIVPETEVNVFEQAEESQRFPPPKETCEAAARSKHANGSALMLPAHRACLELPLV
jgi:hypothetical protein